MRRVLFLVASLPLSVILGIPTVLALEASPSQPAIVALVNGKAIDARVLEAPSDDEIRDLEQEIAELRRVGRNDDSQQQEIYERERRIFERKQKRLDEAIGQELLAQEAAKTGVTIEALLAKEVDAKVPAVTEEQVEKFYERYKDRLVSRPEAELKAKARSILEKYRRIGARGKYVESLRARASISTFLKPPVLRFEIPVAGAPFRGSAAAPVTIVKFEDFHCSFCQSAQDTLAKLLAAYGERVRLVHRDFPIDPESRSLAHEAARCADLQGRFWAYHDALYANAGKTTAEELKAHAGSTGLDVPAFEQCLERRTFRTTVEREVDEGKRLGVKATPTFFVNGRPLVGAQPLDQFMRLIEEELTALSP